MDDSPQVYDGLTSYRKRNDHKSEVDQDIENATKAVNEFGKKAADATGKAAQKAGSAAGKYALK